MHDLRISVTDRCNFRCVYCMPREVFDSTYRFLPHDAILSFEEIARLARIFAELGVQKIRLTGGEPLVRRDLQRLVAMLKELPVELTLTTNGSLLAKQAGELKRAGLDRLTVSLDSLDDATFRAMNSADGRALARQRPHHPVHRIHGRGQHQRLAHGRGGSFGRCHPDDLRALAARTDRS
jgi:cyclic pyranopterin phosphate synthase